MNILKIWSPYAYMFLGILWLFSDSTKLVRLDCDCRKHDEKMIICECIMKSNETKRTISIHKSSEFYAEILNKISSPKYDQMPSNKSFSEYDELILPIGKNIHNLFEKRIRKPLRKFLRYTIKEIIHKPRRLRFIIKDIFDTIAIYVFLFCTIRDIIFIWK